MPSKEVQTWMKQRSVPDSLVHSMTFPTMSRRRMACILTEKRAEQFESQNLLVIDEGEEIELKK